MYATIGIGVFVDCEAVHGMFGGEHLLIIKSIRLGCKGQRIIRLLRHRVVRDAFQGLRKAL